MTVQVRSTTQRRRTSKRDTKYIKHLKSGRHAGKFLVSVPNGKKPNGYTDYKTYGPFSDFDAALAKRDEHQRKLVEEHLVAVPLGREAKPKTLGEWVSDHWLDVQMANDNASSTVSKYRQCLNLHLLPFLGLVPLVDLTKDMIEVWRKGRVKAGVGAATINYALKRLKTCLNAAVEAGHIKKNPADRVKGVEVARTKRKPTFDIYPKLIAAADQARGMPNLNHLAPVVQFTADSGFRASEVVAVHWGDLELDYRDPKTGKPAPRVAVNWHTSTSGEAKTDGIINAFRPGTKTSDGEPDYVALSPRTADMLRQHQTALREFKLASRPWAKMAGRPTEFFYAQTKNDRSGKRYIVPTDPGADDALVFPSYDGTPMSVNDISAWFRGVCKRAGVKHTFHGMRHDCGSFMLADQVPLTVVSRHLRHANTAITAERYAHQLREQERMGANAMDARWASLEAPEERAV